MGSEMCIRDRGTALISERARSLINAVPYPNLDRQLDFGSFGIGRISDPTEWPKPFAFDRDTRLRMHDLGDDHCVLAVEDASLDVYQ